MISKSKSYTKEERATKDAEKRQAITDRVIANIERGVIPWQQPWAGSIINGATGRRYTGINILSLASAGMELDGGADPRWATFHQAQEKGWKVKKGAKANYVLMANMIGKTDKDGDPILDSRGNQEMFFMKRFYPVFHASMIEGIPPYENTEHDFKGQANPAADKVIVATSADIRHGGFEAYHRKKADYIQIPNVKDFYDYNGYYATLFHELTHWTGTESRLNREENRLYSTSKQYRAREELVAELGAMFLCAETGVPMTETRDSEDNHAAYIESWLRNLKDDSNALFTASAAASKATDYILSFSKGKKAPAPKETPAQLTLSF